MTFVCLYHRTDRTDFSREDILLRAVGGKKTSKSLICGEHNNKLGSELDKQLTSHLEWVTTLVNPEGRRRAAPTLRNVADQNGDVWDIEPGGTPRVTYGAISSSSWRADVSQLDLVKQNALAKAKALNIDNPAISVEHKSTQAGVFQFQLNLPEQIAFRSGCKAALEGLALLGFDEADRRSELLLDAREYVLNGGSYKPVGWVLNSVRAGAFFEGLDSSILLVQSDDLSVYWEFIIYGGVVAVAGRFAPINREIKTWLYKVSPETGEAEESNPEITVAANFSNWSLVTPDLQARTQAILQKVGLRVQASFVSEELCSELDKQDYLDREKIVQKYADHFSKQYGIDREFLMSYITDAIKDIK